MGQRNGVADPTTTPLRPAAPVEQARHPAPAAESPAPTADVPDKSDGGTDRAPSTRRPGRWRALPSHARALPGHVRALPSHARALPEHVRALPRHVGRGLRAGFRATAAWSRRPYTRVFGSALLIVTVAVGSVLAGAYVVPALPTPTQRAFAVIDHAAVPGLPGTGVPGTDSSAAPGGTGTGAMTKPSDLATWARPLSAKLGIPLTAMQAYGYAELATAAAQPSCQLRWTTLAGIGKIESAHGQHQATLAPDGKALPPIVGAPLDGQGGRMTIHDTDGGRLDGDRVWDHAVGPMQFIPSTWATYGSDADGDGGADINDINDAALAAARYLCAGNRNLSVAGDWWAAIMSYNAVQAYIQDVYTAANDYGVRSR